MGGSSAATTQPLGSGWTGAEMSALNLGNGVTMGAVNMPPELRDPNIQGLQTMAKDQSEINALNSKALEEEMTPGIADIRGQLTDQVQSDLKGDPSTQLSNMWLKQGLNDVITAGGNTNGTFARSALADTTRQDYYQNRDAQQAKAAALLQANPMPVAGLDVGSLAGTMTQASTDNANALDAYKANVLGALSNQQQNSMGAIQQSMQMEMQNRNNNTMAQNTMTGSNKGLTGSLMGAGIGAAGVLGGAAIIF